MYLISGRYNEPDASTVGKQEQYWNDLSILGPNWANHSAVKMKELEVFKTFDKVQAESCSSRSVNFGNKKVANGMFGIHRTTVHSMEE